MNKEQNRAYLVALLVAALAGLPIAAIAVAFVSAVHGLTTLFWTDIPKDLLDVSEPPGGTCCCSPRSRACSPRGRCVYQATADTRPPRA
jgi:hypothetical protein